LGDRVAVFTANPGTLREVVKIDLPRPRHNSDIRSSAEFGWIRHKIWELLQNHPTNSRPPTDSRTVAEAISPSVSL
jgi:NitT/TauT family transport system ATP-binding protein